MGPTPESRSGSAAPTPRASATGVDVAIASLSATPTLPPPRNTSSGPPLSPFGRRGSDVAAAGDRGTLSPERPPPIHDASRVAAASFVVPRRGSSPTHASPTPPPPPPPPQTALSPPAVAVAAMLAPTTPALMQEASVTSPMVTLSDSQPALSDGYFTPRVSAMLRSEAAGVGSVAGSGDVASGGGGALTADGGSRDGGVSTPRDDLVLMPFSAPPVPAPRPQDSELHRLVSYGYHSDAALVAALRSGAVVSAQNVDGDTALHLATKQAYFFGMQARATLVPLVCCSCFCNTATLIGAAVSLGRVQALVEAGCNVDCRNLRGGCGESLSTILWYRAAPIGAAGQLR